MNYGLYQSAGGVLATMHRYEVLSNNLANVETTAFKADLAVSMERLPARIEQGALTDPNRSRTTWRRSAVDSDRHRLHPGRAG